MKTPRAFWILVYHRLEILCRTLDRGVDLKGGENQTPNTVKRVTHSRSSSRQMTIDHIPTYMRMVENIQ